MAGAPYGIVDEDTDISLWRVTPTGRTSSLRLSDIVANAADVTSFGAVGDGVTDDTAAFTAALSAQTTVYAPGARTYRVTNLDLSVADQTLIGHGATLMPLAGSQWTVRLKAQRTGLYGCIVDDASGNTTAQTTVTVNATSGASTLVVANTAVGATPIVAGQRYAVRLDTGLRASGYILGVVLGATTTTVTLDRTLPANVTASKTPPFWSSFGTIYVTKGASNFRISDLELLHGFAGILVDNPAVDGSGIPSGYISGINMANARLFGLCFGREANNNYAQNMLGGGGSQYTKSWVTDGIVTHFAVDEVIWKPDKANFTLTGAAHISANVSLDTRADVSSGNVISMNRAKAAELGMSTGGSPPANVPVNATITAIDLAADTVTLSSPVTGLVPAGTTIAFDGGITVDSDGLGFTLETNPGSGKTLTVAFGAHGSDGYVVDGTGTKLTASTNALSNSRFSGYGRGGYIGAGPVAAWMIHNSVFDSCSEACLRLDGCQGGFLSSAIIGYGPIGIDCINGAHAEGVAYPNAVPAGQSNTGVAGVPVNVDGTSKLTGMMFPQSSRGFQLYDNTLQVTQNANKGFQVFEPLVVNQNTAQSGYLAPFNSNSSQIIAADTTSPFLEVRAAGGGTPTFAGFACGGTMVVPTATTGATTMSRLEGLAYDGTAIQVGCHILLVTNQTWTGTKRSSRIEFKTVPNDTTSAVLAATLEASGGLTLNAATDKGLGALSTTAGVFTGGQPVSSLGTGAVVKQTSGASYTVADGVRTVILDSVTSPYTLTMPAAPVAGHVVEVLFGAGLASLTVSPNSGQTMVATRSTATEVTTQGHRWVFDGTSKWYMNY